MTRTPPKVFAVVPAAGCGQRMGSDTPKQYLPLLGKPVIAHSLDALLAVPAIKQIMVVISEDDPEWNVLARSYDERVQSVIGGPERAYSVMNAINALPAAAEDWVLVHDAARPCITPVMIESMLVGMENDAVGGLLALPVTDTLKLGAGDCVTQTLDRTGLWYAQTPQMFRYGLLEPALASALAAGVIVTDESAAMERAGHAPRLLMGSVSNLKITRPMDLSLAAYWLQSLQELS